MSEKRKVSARLGNLEEVTLKAIKTYIATFLEKELDNITDTEAINFAIRCTGTLISSDETVQGAKKYEYK